MVGAGIAGLVLALAVVGASPAAAETPLPVWSSANEVGVPTAVGLVSLACPSAGSCVAVGSYTIGRSGAFDGSEPALVAETDGVWGRASEVALPANASPTGDTQFAALDSVTCTGRGNCVAVGYYSDNYSHAETGDSLPDSQAMVVTERGGVWGQAREITLPANAAPTAGMQFAALESVTCTAQGNCVAVGNYADSTGSTQAMAVGETGGAWGRAIQVALPLNATTAPDDGDAVLNSVTCTGPGGCVAVGHYADSGSDDQPMAMAQRGGVWGRAGEVTLPANAITASVGQDLDSVACTSPGNCVAVGNYTDASDFYGGYQAMVVAETRGVWRRASEVAPPPNASATGPGSGFEPDLKSVTCTGPGNCLAVGGAYGLAMAVAETGGVWGLAGEVIPPANAATIAGGEQSTLTAVTCASLGSCVAIGTYPVRVDPQAMTVSLVSPTVATVGDRRITLITSPPPVCTARPARLGVAFDSMAIPKSRGEKLRFASAAFSIGKGIKHTDRQTVRTRGGGETRSRVTVYLPNAQSHHVPFKVDLSLAGVKDGTHTLHVVVSYRKTKREHGRTRTVLVTKTLSAKFSLC